MGLTFTKDEQPTLANFNKRFGDIYSKEEVLSDDVKTLLGLGADDTPDVALTKIERNLNAGWILLEEYLTAGSYTWIAPDLCGGQDYDIGVLIVGGGGSGASRSINATISSSTACYGGGGASGYCVSLIKTVSPGSTHDLVVGAGGSRVIASSSSTSVGGITGGTSSFDGIVANGGTGGIGSTVSCGSAGGQCSCSPYAKPSFNLFGGIVVPVMFSSSNSTYTYRGGDLCFNVFEGKAILAAGGGCAALTAHQGGKDPVTGLGGGDGAYNAQATDATDGGCGGGGVVSAGTSVVYYYSGSGADGYVKIYVRRVAQ